MMENKTKIDLKNTSIFITGAAGFIGSNLAKRILTTVEGAKVVGLDNMNHYYDVRLKEARLDELNKFENFSFVKGNLADNETITTIFEQYKPQTVVNLGAQAGVRYSITNPDAYVEANLIGFYNILEACRHSYDEGHTPVEHLVYASSSSVYGSNKKVPYSTDDKVDNPVSLYLEPMEMILTAKAAENQYVGVSCGKLDQSCEVLSKKNHLLYLDTKDDSYELIPTNETMKPYKVAIFFSGLERSLKNSKYNLRQDECKAAAYALMGYAGMDYDTFANTRLRDVPFEVFESYKDRLPELWRRRAEHYYSEFARAENGAELWRKGDLEGYGQLVFESGKSSIYSYIDFSKLPNQFVLKCTHDSGGLVICTDKSKLDMTVAKKKIEKSLKNDYYMQNREWPYKNVKRRIIAEEYMVDESGYELKDYKIFAFDGEAKAMFIASDRTNPNEETKFDFFDMDFNHLPFTNGHPNSKEWDKIKRPKGLDEMKKYAEILSKGLPEARIDFYDINGKVYFGEITFFHWSGFERFEPAEWDEKFGSWITLPTK